MPQRRPYKDVSLQQLRSFCETARLQSFKAAAAALGLAHPTVWEQVHALQRHLGTKLVETHGRGSRLTADGLVLAQMIGPVMSDLDSLKRRFLEARCHTAPQFTVVTTPRTLIEDLPAVLAAFARIHPQVEVCLLEVDPLQVAAAVESQAADLGITADHGIDRRHALLVAESCYTLDLILLTQLHHPLAKLKRITPQHLTKYPLVDGKGMIPDPAILAALEKLRLFDAQPRRVEARTNEVIRHYVKLGYGIGLVAGRLGLAANRGLHERSLSKYFGRFEVNLVWRKGSRSEFIQAFAEIYRRQFATP